MEDAVKLSDEESQKPIKCSVRTFLVSNLVWGLLSLGLLGTATYAAISPTGVFIVFPQQMYFGVIGVGAFGTLLCLMGLYGSRRSNECCILCFIFLLLIFLIVQLLLFVYLLLYANGVATFDPLDASVLGLQQEFESFLVSYAQEKPADYKLAQDQLNCCGVDFEAGCNQTAGNTFLTQLESGNRCSTFAGLAALRSTLCIGYDESVEDVIPEAVADENVGRATRFFCKDAIASFFSDNTIVIAAVFGVLLLIEFSSLVSSLRLYWVPKGKGGFSEAYDEKYGMAKPKTAQELGGGITGNVKAFGNRLSYRLGRATFQEGAAPPGPPGAGGGFANNIRGRLSMRRGGPLGGPPGGPPGPPAPFVSQMSQQAPAAPPPGGMGGPPRGPPPSMMKRFSKRLGLGGFGGPPRGPPPGAMGGGGGNQMGGPRPGAPAGAMGPPPPRGAFKRMSARLQQGLGQLGRGIPMFGRGPPRGPPPGMGPPGGSTPPPMGSMGVSGGPPGAMGGGPPRGMGGPPRGMGGPPRGMGGPPMGGMGGPPRGMGGPPMGGMGEPPRGMGGPPMGGMGGPPRGMGGPPMGGMGGPPRGGGMSGPPPPRPSMPQARKPKKTKAPKKTRGGPPPRAGPPGGGGGPPRGGLLAEIQMRRID